MGHRRIATVACLLALSGCGGTDATSSAEDASANADAASAMLGDTGVCHDSSRASCAQDGAAEGGTPPEAGTPVTSVDSGDAFDGAIPDGAFPGSCDQFSFELTPDATPGTCAFTIADVTCNTTSDCMPYTREGCGCIEPVYGVNKASTANCPALPCSPPFVPCQTSGFGAQDCQVVPQASQVGVSCVAHVCRTFAQ
jgi:hypothetical protein